MGYFILRLDEKKKPKENGFSVMSASGMRHESCGKYTLYRTPIERGNAWGI
jgi:hypothetical protein